MNRIIIIIIFVLLCGSFSFQKTTQYKIPDFVPDSVTAKAVAEIILLKYYGNNTKRYFPLKLKDKSNKTVWILEGSIPYKKGYDYMGGVPYIEIRKRDCCVLKMTHGK
jgi:hypothetical protein